jgi:hypothetical protein
METLAGSGAVLGKARCAHQHRQTYGDRGQSAAGLHSEHRIQPPGSHTNLVPVVQSKNSPRYQT